MIVSIKFHSLDRTNDYSVGVKREIVRVSDSGVKTVELKSYVPVSKRRKAINYKPVSRLLSIKPSACGTKKLVSRLVRDVKTGKYSVSVDYKEIVVKSKVSRSRVPKIDLTDIGF